MTELDLNAVQPSWRNYPPVPSRISNGDILFDGFTTSKVADFETAPVVMLDAPIDDVGGNRPQFITFYPKKLIRGTGSSYTITLNPGTVREVLTADSAANAISVRECLPLEHTITIGQDLYVSYLTDAYGNITEEPAINVGTTPASTHHQPPTLADDPEGSGTGGNYYVKLGTLQANGDGAKWVPNVTSEILHVHDLWAGENLSSEDGSPLYNVFKGRKSSTDAYQFRSLAQLGSDEANPILKPHAEGAPPDQIEVYGVRGLSTGVEGLEPQVNVTVEGDDILVRGNNKSAKLTIQTYDSTVLGEVEWKDGLVVAESNVVVTLPEAEPTTGADLNMTVKHWVEDTTTGVITSGDSDVIHYWRNGLYVGTTAPSGDPPPGLIEQEVAKITQGS